MEPRNTNPNSFTVNRESPRSRDRAAVPLGGDSLVHGVYVLYSLKDRKLYIGYTADLKRRLSEHNRGESASTAPRRPLRLLFGEHYISKKDAQRRERYFKTTAGKRALRLMLKDSLLQAADWTRESS